MALPIHKHRITAFEVPPDGLGVSTYLTEFPGAWLRPLREFAGSNARPGEKARIPIRSLNAALQALVPDLAISLNGVTQKTDGNQPWLVSDRPLPADRLMLVVAAWVHSQRNERTPGSVLSDTIAAIVENPLTSILCNLDEIAETSVSTRLRILEAQAARLLTEPDVFFDPDGLRQPFVRVASSGGSGGEIMSWPPALARKDQTYSVVARAAAQTVPGEVQPLLYLHYGIRRWVFRTPRIAFNNSTSVYLQTAVPYIEAVDSRQHFAIAKAVARRVDKPGTEKGYETEFVWRDSMIKVLDHAHLSSALPDLTSLMSDPSPFRNSETAAALIPFKYGRDSAKQAVSAGLGPFDRNRLLDWTAGVLDTAKLHDPLGRATYSPPRAQPVKKPKLQRTSVTNDLAATVGSRLTIELMTSSEESTQLVLDALEDRIPGGLAVGATATIHTSAGHVEVIVTRPDVRGHVVAPLDPPADRRDKQHAVARVREIRTWVEPAAWPTITIAEIETAETFTKSPMVRRDPKNAIRHGLARTGRISQFVNPVVQEEPPVDDDTGTGAEGAEQEPQKAKKDPNLIRYEKAVDDVFRQLGVRPMPFVTQNPVVTPDLRYLGFWMLRRNKTRSRDWAVSVPLAVQMRADCSEILVRSAKLGWMPLHEFGPQLGTFYGGDNKLERDDKGEGFIFTTLQDVCRAGTPVLLLTHAQNLRSAWRHIQNPNIGRDQIGFGGSTWPITNYPNLRHVRVRTSDQYETPEVFGYREEQEGVNAVGRSRGLWAFRGDRLFGSIADKPSTDKGTKLSNTKLRAPEESRAGLSSLTVSPQLLEVYAAAIQPGDDPVHWAALAHELRDANPYHYDETLLPWPLRVAEQLGEYITPDYVEPEDESISEDSVE